jgi:hypothetical protein
VNVRPNVAKVRTRAPITAVELLASVEAFCPAVEGAALVLDADLPADLESALQVLHTGRRALLAGRKWFGSTCGDGKRAMVIELDPSKPILLRIGLLCVEADKRWDRIDPAARIDIPELFAE